MRALDFSQPTKFTTELKRRIGRALDPFCDALGAWLSSELRADVVVSLTEIGQLTWAAAKSRLPADVIAVDVEASSISRHMLISVEQQLVLQALECMLGGEAAQAPEQRHLTEIDWVLTRGLLDAVVHELSVAWSDDQRSRADARTGRHRKRRRRLRPGRGTRRCRSPSAARSTAWPRRCPC